MKIPLMLHDDGNKSLGNLIATAILLPLSSSAPGCFCHLLRRMETAI